MCVRSGDALDASSANLHSTTLRDLTERLEHREGYAAGLVCDRQIVDIERRGPRALRRGRDTEYHRSPRRVAILAELERPVIPGRTMLPTL
jgi:hypothetical protein